jgi:hypothetical protein
MKHEETKMILSATAAQAVVNAQPAAVDALLGKAIPNVVGIGAGIKWKNGVPTGDPALVVLVTHKVAKDDLDKASLIPAKLQNLATDVLAVGHLFALDEDPILEEDEDPILEEDEDPILEEDEDPILEEDEAPILEEARRKRKALKRKLRRLAVKARKYRVRPLTGGISVGHRNVTAGTIGACVYDFLPDGVGKPSRYYILSNNHVLANSNAANIGDTILQPGRADGGLIPRDRIGRLSRFIPIQFAPDVALAAQNNLVDAALAAVPFHLLNGGIKWIGDVRGWRQKSAVTVGTMVKKVGRTTNLTTGRIIVVNATVDVNYRGGKVARFKEQLLTTNMSAGGDSGSLITTSDNVAVGLLFAGSSQVTVANQIENVRSLLRVEIAEQSS